MDKVGMDLDEVRIMGSAMQQHAKQISESIVPALDSVVGKIPGVWRGRDAELFVQWWRDQHRARLLQVGSDLYGLGQSALNNAEEQEWASGTGPGGPAIRGTDSAGLATLGIEGFSVEDLPALGVGKQAVASDYVTMMMQLDANQIGLRLVDAGPPPKYVMMLRGLDSKDLDWDGSNSWPSTLKEYVGKDSPYQRRIAEILDSLPPNAKVAMIGHSQGGLAAMEAASRHTQVQELLIMGSPIDDKALPKNVKSAFILEAHADPIARFDGGDPIGEPGAAERIFTSVVGGGLGIGLGPLGMVAGTEIVQSAMHQAAKWQEDVPIHGPGGTPKTLFTDPGATGPNPIVHHNMGSYAKALRDLEGSDTDIGYRGNESVGRSSLVVFNHYWGGGATAEAPDVYSVK